MNIMLFVNNVSKKLPSKALGNTGWLVGEKILVMGLSLLVNIAIARVFGPALFGEFSYLLSLFALLGPIGTMGINAIVSREIINNPDKSQEIIGSAVFIRLLGVLAILIISLLVWAEGSLLESVSFPHGLLFLAIAGLFTSFQVVEFWFQAKVASKYIVRWRIPVAVVFAMTKLYFLWLGANLQWLVLVYALELSVMGLVVLLVYSRSVTWIKYLHVNITYALSLLRQSFWLIFSGFASIIYLKIDQVMLGKMATNADVGVYAVASRLSEVWYFFPEAVMASFFASLLVHRKNNQQEYYRKIQSLCDALFASSLLLAMFVSLFSSLIVGVLYGDGYGESSVILSIHIWAGCFVFMRALLSKWLIAENLLKFSLVSHGLGALVNVVLNYWMIQQWQGVGAALATVISYAVASYFALFIYGPTRKMAYIMTTSILLPIRLIVMAPNYLLKKV